MQCRIRPEFLLHGLLNNIQRFLFCILVHSSSKKNRNLGTFWTILAQFGTFHVQVDVQVDVQVGVQLLNKMRHF